jgi:hypothetical protein
MKSISRILLVGAVAVMAIAISAAPSEAAKKKRMKGARAGTYYGELCSLPTASPGVSAVMIWGYDRKWYQAAVTPTCLQPVCPVSCR